MCLLLALPLPLLIYYTALLSVLLVLLFGTVPLAVAAECQLPLVSQSQWADLTAVSIGTPEGERQSWCV